MSSKKERVFVIGATGDIGSNIVRGLIKKQINTTAYVRTEQKAKDLFMNELKTGLLEIVVGTYSSSDIYTKAIQGHTRLLILVADVMNKPTAMSKIKGTFGKIAYEQGVLQIVDISSVSVRTCGKQGIIAYAHTIAEEKLWALADANPEQRSLVVLRPAAFMTNHLKSDVQHVKRSDKLLSCGHRSSKITWIDTKDISDCAVVILAESIEKHDRNVYEMGAESLSNEERAAIFSKVLGKPIKYEQQSIEDFYKTYTGLGIPHGYVYNLTTIYVNDISGTTTPQLSVIIGRPLRTFEEWLRENAKAFQ